MYFHTVPCQRNVYFFFLFPYVIMLKNGMKRVLCLCSLIRNKWLHLLLAHFPLIYLEKNLGRHVSLFNVSMGEINIEYETS